MGRGGSIGFGRVGRIDKAKRSTAEKSADEYMMEVLLLSESTGRMV